ncbi:MAG: hypothetical protein ACM3NQ_19470 [Bacteroidales bacterium]
MAKQHLSGVVVAGCLAGALACGSKPPAQGAAGGVIPTYNDQTGRLTQLKSDRDKDGKIDTWATMDGSRVVKIEIDENGDGKPDRWEYYKPGTGAEASGVLERVEVATRFDGKVSRREFLENGHLARIEEDTDGNGATDKWETYKDGGLVLMELDTSQRGKPDRRLVYGADGSLDHIEADADGSGNMKSVTPAGRSAK